MTKRRFPFWQYVDDWAYCSVCGCLRPERALVRPRAADGPGLWRCRDGAWCAMVAGERARSLPPEESSP